MASPQKLPVVILACEIMKSMLPDLLPDGLVDQLTYFDYGLHRVPNKLTWTLQEAIDSIETPSLIVLGYGLCGNGLNGIRARQHTLLIPRVDDCIAILLGSHKKYMQEFEAVPGTYYLSKGWLESGSHPLKEYHEYVEKYGEKDAAWVMDQQYRHYDRLALVAHTPADIDKYRAQAEAVARYCEQWGMRYEEILGSDVYVRRMIEVIAALEKADDDFVIVPPGGEIRQEQFIR